ncbi:MAG: hypothetical protein JNM99_21405 [Verrucomicrobiaceae bacterium]|nr:hypothetical protein [Verrucomicrobiaceae bacterium]
MKTALLIRSASVSLLASAMMTLLCNAQAPSDKATVSGKFLGNGKDGNIQYLLVQNTEPFSDKPAIQLIFAEKDPSKSKKPDWDAGFKKFGSALVVSTHRDGSVFGCEVAHSEHQKSPFSSVGRVKIKDMKVTDTHVSGTLTTGGPGDFFGQTWDVELTFSAPLPKGAFAAVAKPEPAPEKEKEATAKASAPLVPVSKVALPAGALDVEYKEAVEQITFRSDSSVTTVAKDFAAKLKAKGWTDAPGGLMGKTNTMMRRKLDEAALTIMIQSADKGCSVKIFTEGLDWSNTPEASTPTEATTKVDGLEAEANRLLNEALKNLPKF